MKPGFYWLIPPAAPDETDGLPEDRHIGIVGPFPTNEGARSDALSWINDVLSQPELKEAA